MQLCPAVRFRRPARASEIIEITRLLRQVRSMHNQKAMDQLRTLDGRESMRKASLLPAEVGTVDVVENCVVDAAICDKER